MPVFDLIIRDQHCNFSTEDDEELVTIVVDVEDQLVLVNLFDFHDWDDFVKIRNFQHFGIFISSE